MYLHKCLLFYRPLNLTDSGFNSDHIKKKSLSEESLLGTDSIILEQPKNYSLPIKPLGDINVKLEDIIPCMYKVFYLKNYILLFYTIIPGDSLNI